VRAWGLPSGLVAVTAVDWSVVSGFKWYLCGCSTLSADCIMHFSSAVATGSSAATCLSLVTAVLATSGLVLETFFRVEFLLTYGENEF